jgi:glutamate/tyrosine decarboxylase-like PLP-dependent enzyme
MATGRNLAETIQENDLLRDAAERARFYLQGIGERRVSPQESDLVALAQLHEPLPVHGSSPQQTLAMLDATGSPATMATAGRRYFGFVIGGSFPVSMAANWLAAAWDQNAALRVMSPIAAELEEVVLSWVCEAFGLPADCEGGLVTCATTANFTALAAARYSLLAKAGWDVAEDGMFGAPPLEVVVGEEVHASVSKALSLAGLGRRRVHIVEADAQGRMRAEKLPKLTARTIVCIQAGNVNTGSFDPAAEICERACDAGAWVHVDGAFGMWARLSPKYATLLAGF